MTNAQTLALKWTEIKLSAKYHWTLADSIVNDKPSSPIDTIGGRETLLLAAIAAKTGYTAARAAEEYLWFMNPWRIATSVSQ
jgi:hypothetical protein